MSGMEHLCNAIIVQAVKDYRAASRKLKRSPENTEAQACVGELERFFLSDWFAVLTDADGQQILNQLRKEVA